MKILLNKSKINHNNLKKFIIKIVSEELSNLTEPCYTPKLKKYYFNLLNLTGLNEKDIKEFVKRFYYGTLYSEFQLQKDPITNLIIFIMYYFLNINDIVGYNTTMLYFNIRYYTNLMSRQFPKFCDTDAFRYALENIAKTHLFSREKTIPNALYFMSKEIMKRYTSGIHEGNPEIIAKMITESRTRISQSIKSFAEIYYKALKSSTIIRNPYESGDSDENKYQEEVQDKYQKIIDIITKKICVYKYIDKKAILDAKSITKINISIATLLSNTVIDVKYIDDIKIIMKLFLKNITEIKMLCGKDYFTYLRDIMSIKRTSSTIYFKQQINLLVERLVNDIKYKEKYDKLSSQSRFMISLYVALYLTMILRNTIC